MAIIHNYTKKKARGAARLVKIDATSVRAEERERDDDDNQTWVTKDTHTVKHLNDLIASATAARDAFVAQYQPQLQKLNRELANLEAIKTDTEATLNAR